MREIKFRGLPVEDIEENGWHVSKNEFVYGSLIVDGRTCFIVNGEFYPCKPGIFAKTYDEFQ